ncbi:hypothetical protein [Mucilaginibacter psychrotolerans]|uniref:Uncharacterized protein n=1 Tax=Mucilaginibacter psychrotolerans TaxID=1524096 RepID=A0A4Y8SDU3_9SPHI|nr:hypothetical protein [Mucilaginibacter psychrotolerans]TFF37273.1 hypothetical protein E2R66_12615 [Mucilaginibacter psychrotolerans]
MERLKINIDRGPAALTDGLMATGEIFEQKLQGKNSSKIANKIGVTLISLIQQLKFATSNFKPKEHGK